MSCVSCEPPKRILNRFSRLCLESRWIQVKVDGMLGLGDFWNQWFHLMMASFTHKSSCFKMGILRFVCHGGGSSYLGYPRMSEGG